MDSGGQWGRTLAVMLVLVWPHPAAAGGEVISEAAAARWRAVGALNAGGHRACSAALISDHEAITAAHCVVNRTTGQRVAPEDFQLVLGQTAAGSAAVRGVRAVAFPPGYTAAEQTAGIAGLATDIALLELDAPVSPQEAVPLQVVDWPAPVGDLADIVGYERGGPEAATVRAGCRAVASVAGVTAVTCDVIPGLSGAAVLLQQSPADPPKLVASVSSRSTGGGSALAFVVSVAPHLTELRALIEK